MTVELRFLEDRLAVGDHLEPPLARRDQLDDDSGKVLAKLGRQTDGPRFVVSHRAVFDLDFHSQAFGFWLLTLAMGFWKIPVLRAVNSSQQSAANS